MPPISFWSDWAALILVISGLTASKFSVYIWLVKEEWYLMIIFIRCAYEHFPCVEMWKMDKLLNRCFECSEIRIIHRSIPIVLSTIFGLFFWGLQLNLPVQQQGIEMLLLLLSGWNDLRSGVLGKTAVIMDRPAKNLVSQVILHTVGLQRLKNYTESQGSSCNT